MLEESCGEAHFYDVALNPRTALMASGCEAVNVFVNDDCSAETLHVLKDLGVQMVTLRCAGFNNVDVEEAQRLGLAVARVPTYSPESVAEHAVALLLTLSRQTHQSYIRTNAGNFSLNGLVGFEIHGKTIGVVGTGNIGLAAIRIFNGFGTRVIAHDPYGKPELAEQLGFEYVSMEELLETADIISLHCPLVPATHHLINRKSISRMKPGVTLLNTSRGGLVDTDALLDGLRSFQVGAYGMDVYENESELFFRDFSQMDMKSKLQHWDSKFQELMNLPNVLVTPHQAFLTEEALCNIGATTVQNLSEFCSNSPLSNQVLPEADSQRTPRARAGGFGGALYM